MVKRKMQEKRKKWMKPEPGEVRGKGTREKETNRSDKRTGSQQTISKQMLERG